MVKRKNEGGDSDEDAFPRGKPTLPAAQASSAGDEDRPLPKVEKKKAKKQPAKKDEEEDDLKTAQAVVDAAAGPSSALRLRSSDLVEGTVMLGAVREVSKDEVIVNLPFHLVGYVSRAQATEATLESELPKLEDAFRIGQLLITVVTSVVVVGGRKNGKNRIELSLRPSLANAGLEVADVEPHMWLPAVVESEEEHVFGLNFGVSGLKGLLKKDEVSGPTRTGSVVNVSVVSVNAASSMLRCSTKADQPLEEKTAVKMESLKAGFLVHGRVKKIFPVNDSGRPASTEESNNGVLLNFCGALQGVVHRHHLTSGAAVKQKQRVSARVVAVVPGTPSVIYLTLAAHHLEWDSGPASLLKVNIGRRLEAEIVDYVPKYGCRLTYANPKGGELAVFCPSSRMADDNQERPKSFTETGAKASCRVLAHNLFDQALVVSRRRSDLKEDVLISVSELSPGQLMVGEVERIAEFGVLLKLSEFVTGLVSLRQITDVPLAAVPKKYVVGAKVKVRVLKTDPEKRHVSLTAKKSLVRASFQLCDFASARNNMIVSGFVSKIQPFGALVSFFGEAYGLIPVQTFDEESAPALGMAVKVRITEVHRKRQRLALSLDLEGGRDPADLANDDPGDGRGKAKPGTLASSMRAVRCDADGVHVTFATADGEAGKLCGFVPLAHLADELTQAKARHASIAASLEGDSGKGKKIESGVVLASAWRPKALAEGEQMPEEKKGESWPALVSLKPLMLLAQADGDFVSDFAQLEAPKLYSGYVKEVHDFGVLVSLGGWRFAGLAPKQLLLDDRFLENPSEAFAPGQTVRALVNKVDVEKRRYTVDLRSFSAQPSDGMLLRREAAALNRYFELQVSLALAEDGVSWAALAPGTVLSATVAALKPYGAHLSIKDHKGLTALVLSENVPEGTQLKEGSKVKCAVLDFDAKSKIVDVSLMREIIEAGGAALAVDSTKRNKKKAVSGDATQAAEVFLLPALQKAAYSVFWAKDGGVVYAPPFEKRRWTEARPCTVYSGAPHEVPAGFGRRLVQCPHGGSEGRSTQQRLKVPKILRPEEELQVGVPITMRTRSVQGLQLVCTAAVGLIGHVHATQFLELDGSCRYGQPGAGSKPLAAVEKKSVMEARVLEMKQHGKTAQGKIYHLELTARPSLNSTAQDSARYAAAHVTWKTLKSGQPVLAAVQEVRKNHVWFEVASGIRGQVRAIDISPDLAVAKNSLTDLFSVGQVFEATVLRAVKGAKKLDLTLHGTPDGPAPLGRTLARLESVSTDLKGGGVVGNFRLPCNRRGFVHVTELFDFWATFPLKKLRVGALYEAHVLQGAVEKQGSRAELSLRSTIVHGQKEAAEEKRPLKAEAVKAGQKVSGYVINACDKGVFVALSRSLVARIRLGALSDKIVTKDAVAQMHPRGSLIQNAVVAHVDAANGRVELTLKKGDPAGRMTVEQLSVGDVVSGQVKSVQKYGLFVRIENSSVDGLVHSSEVSESASTALESYPAGTHIAKAKVVKIDNGKVWLTMKASNFDEEEEDLVEDSDDEEFRLAKREAEAAGEERDVSDSDADIIAQASADKEVSEPPKKKKKTKAKVEVAEPKKAVDSDDEAPWLRKAGNEAGGAAFDFEGFGGLGDEDGGSDEEPDTDDDGDAAKKSKRQKKSEKRAEKEEMLRREAENADAKWANDPKSIEDFERLLLTEGTTSIVWIRYMAFHLKTSDLERARQVADRAVKHVGFVDAKERFNVWVALLNLECTFGTEASAEAAFKRAAAHNNAKQIYLQLARIHERNKKVQQAVHVHEEGCKKFLHSKKMWIGFLTFLYGQADLEGARKVLPRALAALARRKHPMVVSKAALLEYQHGSTERGRSVFEGLLDSYPKRMDLWSVYIDAHIKAHTPPKATTTDFAEIRGLLERCCSARLKAARMRFFFKRWLDFEKRWGDEESQELVRSKAREFVESQAT